MKLQTPTGTMLMTIPIVLPQWCNTGLKIFLGDDDERQQQQQQMGGILSSMSTSYGHNPVVRALGRAVQESNLMKRFIERLLDAREADFDLQQLPTVDYAIMYAEDTSSSFLYLTVECCDVREDAADEVACHVSLGLGKRAANVQFVGGCAIHKCLVMVI